jgi:uncharacterized protein (TIGR00369 family)
MQEDERLSGFPESVTARLLAQHVIGSDPEQGSVQVQFHASSEFANPAGFIQGGILAAMLDDTMGPALWFHSKGTAYPVTIDMTICFLSATPPGRINGEGRVVQSGKTVAFLEAQLTDPDGKLVARAIASVRLVKVDNVQIKRG